LADSTSARNHIARLRILHHERLQVCEFIVIEVGAAQSLEGRRLDECEHAAKLRQRRNSVNLLSRPPANTPAHRKVVETRRREYPRRPKANQFRKDGRQEYTDDPGGVGTETVREILVCPSCFEPSTGSESDPRGPSRIHIPS